MLYYPRLWCSLPDTIKSEQLLSKIFDHSCNLWVRTLSLPFCYKADVEPKQTGISVATETFLTIITTERSTLLSGLCETIMYSRRERTKYTYPLVTLSEANKTTKKVCSMKRCAPFVIKCHLSSSPGRWKISLNVHILHG